ncbi:MAG: hypothetical protein QM697_16965 [Lachnospiraceae bacterium]
MVFWIIFVLLIILCGAVIVSLANKDVAEQSGRRRTVVYLQMALAIAVLLLNLLFGVFFLVKSRSGELKEADRKARQEYEKEQQRLKKEQEEQRFSEEQSEKADVLSNAEYPVKDKTKQLEKKREEIAAELEAAQEEKERLEGELKKNLEDDVTTPEGAYKCLYDSVFEQEGYKYLTTYNAKGNFYGILYKGEGVFGDTPDRQISITAVYNGESQNGKCQVFVQYKELLDETGNVVQTGIMDFYAVNMQTKEVIRGDKHAWEELGSKEYVEATEK